MNKSESVVNIMAALIKAQSEFPEVPKTKEVIVQGSKGSYTFKYAPLESMIKLLRPALTANGLGFTQGASGETLVTTVFHSSGEWFSHSMPLLDMPYEQQYGARFSYRRRYSLKAALGVETDDDDSESQQPPAKPTKITPNSNSFDGVPKERHEAVTRIAGSIVDCFNAGQPAEGYAAYKTITVNEEKLMAWSFLDSKMRRQLKQFDADALAAKKGNGNGATA